MGLESFINPYLDAFAKLELELKNVFINSFECLDVLTKQERYHSFSKDIAPLKKFSNIKISSENLGKGLTMIEHEISGFTQDSGKRKETFEPICKKTHEIIDLFNSMINHINENIEQILNKIESSPHGNKEYGKPFQDLVLNFLDMLFIHELVRDNFPKTKCRGIRMDGFYEKLDTFNARERTGFDFSKLLIECKNKKPDINDLMQCLKYTLCFQTNEISKVPLTLLVCRNAPGSNSSIWEINKRIFDRKIADETRLILILTVADLSEMKDIKLKGGDPAKIIKEKVSTLC